MIDVDENFKNAVINGTCDNQISICVFNYYDDAENPNLYIDNKSIVSESMDIQQSLCDESDFKFGGCIAGSFEIELVGTSDLTGRYITVYMNQTARIPLYPGDDVFPDEDTFPGYKTYTHRFELFSGEVYSCKLEKNQLTRKLVAYDRFYWRGTIDCTNWYQRWHKTNQDSSGCVTLGALRQAILSRFKLVEEQDASHDTYVALPADDFPVHMLSDSVTVADLLRMICEFNGCFMVFNGGGNIEYITVNNGKYGDTNVENYDYYMDVETEDFIKNPFDSIWLNTLEQDDNSHSGTGILNVGVGSNQESLYFLDGNTLIGNGYTKGQDTVANSINTVYNNLDLINKLADNFTIGNYRPATLTAQARLWVQLGDRVIVHINYYTLNGKLTTKRIYTTVLSRHITGIQALKDELSSTGENIRYTEEYFDSN